MYFAVAQVEQEAFLCLCSLGGDSRQEEGYDAALDSADAAQEELIEAAPWHRSKADVQNTEGTGCFFWQKHGESVNERGGTLCMFQGGSKRKRRCVKERTESAKNDLYLKAMSAKGNTESKAATNFLGRIFFCILFMFVFQDYFPSMTAE